jgi:DNA repair exonuclease SbcCD nuclease subunit
MSRPKSFIAVADVHLGAKLYNIPELAEDLKEDFSRIIELAIEKKVDYLFIVGDLFDTNKPTPDLINFVTAEVKKARANGCIVAGIAGDHDKPVGNASWVHLCKVFPVNQLYTPAFLGFDYCDNSMENVTKIKEHEDKENVEWIFLHGQVPELFGFVEDKKRLDFKEIDLINSFPKLKGVILGDIHVPTEGEIHDPLMKRDPLPYIGYCGSLGMVKPSEIGHKKGVLYYDGEKLSRLKFDMTRKFVKLNLGDSLTPVNFIQKYTKFFAADTGKKKPLFVVEYDSSSEELLPQTAPLYDVGLVKLAKVRVKESQEDEEELETVNIRSELNTKGRIEKVLKTEIADKTAFELARSLLNNDDCTAVLDKFKEEALNEKDET